MGILVRGYFRMIRSVFCRINIGWWLLCFLGVLFGGFSLFDNAYADSYRAEVEVEFGLSCAGKSGKSTCTVSIETPGWIKDGWEVDGNGQMNVYIIGNISSYREQFFGGTISKELGYWRPAWGGAIQDRKSWPDAYSFDVTDARIRDEGNVTEVMEGGYLYSVYKLRVCITGKVLWRASGFTSSVNSTAEPCAEVSYSERKSTLENKVALVGRAIDENGLSLSSIFPDVRTEVSSGQRAAIQRRNHSGTGYTFAGWSMSNGGPYVTANAGSGAATYVYGYSRPSDWLGIRSLTSNTTVYAVYKKDSSAEIQGTSAVMEGESDVLWNNVPSDKKKDTPWLNSGSETADPLMVTDCENMRDGCSITFRHYLRRRSGNSSTQYSVTRKIESSNSVEAVVSLRSEDFSEVSNGDFVVVSSEMIMMRPGDRVCEVLTFKNESGKDIKSTVCAKVAGELKTNLGISVNNSTLNNEYGKEVYAKPGDDIKYKVDYISIPQYAYNIFPEKMSIDGEGVSLNKSNPSSMGEVFNRNSEFDWNNVFLVKSNGFMLSNNRGDCSDKGNYSYTCGYVVGGWGEKQNINDLKVSRNMVGSALIEDALTNPVGDDGAVIEAAQTTPNTVNFVAEGNTLNSYVDTEGISDAATVYVPYNFENTTAIRNDDVVVYAGEKAEIIYDIITNIRENNDTGGKYATMVKDAKWGVRVCYEGISRDCDLYSGEGGDLHKDEDIYRSSTKNDPSTRTTIFIPDVPAGTKITVESAVYPENSGDSKNWQDPRGNDSWAFSEPVELTVAKKPSFQVWGGSVYSANTVNVLMAKKWHLEGVNDFNSIRQGQPDDMYIFGSWAELSLVAEGEVRGLASGAGLGYGTTTDAGNAFQQKAIEALGGRNGSDYCLMSTLSIANSDCSSAVVGNLGRSSGRSGDKSSLISDFVQEGDQFNIEGEFSLSDVDDNRKTDKGVYYYDGKNKKLSISESAIGAGATKVVRTNNDIAILGNIVYQNDGYSNLESIPKIIIYAKNINISCSVTRIDAVLIADENINTCDGKKNNEDVSLEARSKQLMINGSVISNTLTLGRTYGAATGKNSVVPAEIINYDTSLYLWANNQSSATAPGKLTETYINELAPRY